MKATVQARISPAERRALAQMARELGWSPSRIVREGLRLVAALHPVSGRPRIAGLAQFHSGTSDLGSNKKHLRGFGS